MLLLKDYNTLNVKKPIINKLKLHYVDAAYHVTPIPLTVSSAVPRAQGPRYRAWSSWSPSSSSSSRSKTGHGLLLLLHPRHGPLPLDGHLEVVWKRLPTGQHLIGHDLGPELVELVLVERSRTPRASGATRPTSPEARATGSKVGTEVGSEAGCRAGAGPRATWRAGPVAWSQGL